VRYTNRYHLSVLENAQGNGDVAIEYLNQAHTIDPQAEIYVGEIE